VAARSKASVWGLWSAETVRSNPIGSMDFCLLQVLCVVRLSPLRLADHPSRGVPPTVVRRCVWSRNLVKDEAMAQWGAIASKKIETKFCTQSNITVHNAQESSLFRLVTVHNLITSFPWAMNNPSVHLLGLFSRTPMFSGFYIRPWIDRFWRNSWFSSVHPEYYSNSAGLQAAPYAFRLQFADVQ